MIFNEWKLKNDFFWEFKWSYNDINNDCFDEEENRHNYTYDLNVKDIMKIESNMVEGMKERKSFTDNKSNKE